MTELSPMGRLLTTGPPDGRGVDHPRWLPHGLADRTGGEGGGEGGEGEGGGLSRL